MSVAEAKPESEADIEWVLDSLIGFLKGPVWNVPIITFVEQKSVIFEPEEEDADESEYQNIHEEYRTLVDRLLGSHMDELGISPEQFEESCKNAKVALSTRFHHTLFEQIWAANDYEIFKRMMIQRNIDLQLQALELLSQRYGLIPDSFVPKEGSKFDFLMDEDALMEEVLRRSLAESKQDEEVESKDSIMKVAIEEKARLESRQEKEKEMLDKAMREAMEIRMPETVSEQVQEGKETTENKSENKSESKSEISPEEIKRRQEYLRKQRDKLMELKQKEREKQVERTQESELLAKRPKSARAIRSAISEEEEGDGDEDKGLAFRKSLAARLKKEVIERSNLLEN